MVHNRTVTIEITREVEIEVSLDGSTACVEGVRWPANLEALTPDEEREAFEAAEVES